MARSGCIIHVCQCEGPLIPVSDAGWQKLTEFARKWTNLELDLPIHFSALSFLNLKPSQTIGQRDKGYHRSCYSKFCNKSYVARYEGERTCVPDLGADVLASSSTSTVDDNIAKATTRSSFGISTSAEPRNVLPPNCIICNKKIRFMSKRGQTKKDKLVSAETLDGGKLRRAAEMRGAEEVLLKIRGKDMVAIEAKYHHRCYEEFTSIPETENPQPAHVSPESDVHFDALFNIFCDRVMTKMMESGKPKPLTSLWNQFHDLGHALGYQISKDSYKSGSLKRRIQTKYPFLKFYQPANQQESQMVYIQSASPGKLFKHVQVLDSSETGTDSDSASGSPIQRTKGLWELNLHGLYTQSLLLREQIRGAPDVLKDVWPPSGEHLTNEVAKNMIPIPVFNVIAWILNLSNVATFDDYVAVPENDYPKLMAVLQDMMYIQSHGKKATPKHYCLAMSIRHLTGSTRVINLLNRFGHCASRASIVSMETALAQMEASRNTSLPKGFEKGKYATVVRDNIDFREDTLSGAGTTHHTNGIIIQRDPKKSVGINNVQSLPSKRRHTLVTQPEELVPYRKKPRLGPAVEPSSVILEEVCSAEKEMSTSSQDSLTSPRTVISTDQLYFLMKSVDVDDRLPNWTGFNTLLHRDQVLVKDIIGYLPVIPASPTNLDTVNTLLVRTLELADELEIPEITLVCDQAIYCKAQEIRWADKTSDIYARLVIRMGDFHTTMSYLSVLGAKYGSAGLKELLVESDVIAHGSINGVLTGKHYNRAMLAHKAVAETMEFFRFQAFLKSLDEEQGSQIINDLQRLVVLFPSLVFDVESSGPTVSDICVKYRVYCEEQSQSNMNFRFWSRYIDEDTKLLFDFVRATRTANFKLHLTTLEEMMPMFFAHDRTHYSRYATAYLQEMKSLKETHPFVYQHIEKEFVAQKTTNYAFSAVADDQAIEQTINRDMKVSGGVIGFTKNENAVQRWILSQKDRALITRKCEELAGMNQRGAERKDLNPSVKARDRRHVDSLIELMEDVMTDPFSLPSEKLLHIASGLAADDDTAIDMLQDRDRGTEAFQKFSVSIATNENGIYEPIPKMNLRKFGQSREKTSTSSSSALSSNQTFSRYLVIGRLLNLETRYMLMYNLGACSHSLASSDGSIAKTQKSTLVTLVEETWKVQQPENIPSGGAIIIDVMAVVNTMKKANMITFGDFAASFSQRVLFLGRKYAVTRIDLVCDVYDSETPSIKVAEHKRRYTGASMSYALIRSDTKLPKQLTTILASSQSKSLLIRFLMEYCLSLAVNFTVFVGYDQKCLMKSGNVRYSCEELECNHIEADTRLILHAKHAAMEVDTVIVVSPDSDVLFILLSNLEFFPDLSEIMIKTGGRNDRIIPLSELWRNMGVNMARALIGYHVFSGCDTVSAFVGKGKGRGFQLLRDSPLVIKTHFQR